MPQTADIPTTHAPWSLMAPDPQVSRKRQDTQPILRNGTEPKEDSEVGPDPVKTAQASTKLFGEDGLTFGDVLDIVNLLHHIPVVGPIYRNITGDQIDPAARLIGGTLYAGPVGLIGSLANIAVEEGTGRDIGANILAAFSEADTPSKNRAISLENEPLDLADAGIVVTQALVSKEEPESKPADARRPPQTLTIASVPEQSLVTISNAMARHLERLAEKQSAAQLQQQKPAAEERETQSSGQSTEAFSGPAQAETARQASLFRTPPRGD